MFDHPTLNVAVGKSDMCLIFIPCSVFFGYSYFWGFLFVFGVCIYLIANILRTGVGGGRYWRGGASQCPVYKLSYNPSIFILCPQQAWCPLVQNLFGLIFPLLPDGLKVVA